MVAENLQSLKQSLPDSTQLVAVSKTQPTERLQEAYNAGQRLFGENKVQEMVEKQEQLPKDIQWHLIGHLQRNKVKYIAPFVSLLHSVDSLKLLKEINKQAAKHERVIPCLLQMHIAEEESKFGLSENEARELLQSEAFLQMQNIQIRGLMGMATNTEDSEQIRKEFRGLKSLFARLKADYQSPQIQWQELSMGMSSDYPIAIEEGSTLVRVGSKIFGERYQ